MENDKKSGTNVVREYCRYLKLERNYSPNTLDAYLRDLQKLLDYLQREGIEPTEVKLENLRHFAAGLHDVGIHPRSQCRILSGIRRFYHFLQIDGYVKDDPTELLESPQIGEHLPEVLSTAEVDMIENSIDLSDPLGQRNKAIIEVLFSCGMRVSELVNFKLSDLYIEEKFVRIIGKGRKERLVPISQRAIDEIKYWFLDRNLMKIKPEEQDYVFLNDTDHDKKSGRDSWNKKDNQSTHFPPFIRYSLVGGRCRPKSDPGNVRSREYRYDRDLYPHRYDAAQR
jgi:integrase/recombinase XerD